MAGDWIKWTCGLPDKPEVIRMAARLKVAREIVVCRLLKFWEWCDANIPDDAIQDSGSAFVDLSPERGDNVAFVDDLVGSPTRLPPSIGFDSETVVSSCRTSEGITGKPPRPAHVTPRTRRGSVNGALTNRHRRR
jgi:hypothetical protein